MAAGDATKHEGTILETFDEIAAAYRVECTRGTPMSVHERYERQLSCLRAELRRRETPHRLGDALRQMGAIREEQLIRALSMQAASGGEKLLGEILIDLGWADEQTIRRAVETQVRDHQEARASVVGASRE